jgi:hypothetical protein
MRSSSIKALLCGFLILVINGGPAAAFSSINARELLAYLITGKPGGFIHRQITEEALIPLQIKKDVIDKIGDRIFFVDWDEYEKSWPPRGNSSYQPAHHFDRNELAACEGCESHHGEAFLRGAKYAADQRSLAIAALKEGNKAAAIEAVGRGLHALEDAFSHSNIVDLSPSDLAAVKKALIEASVPPKILKIAGSGLKKGGDLQEVPGGECLENYDFGHDVCSKDEPTKNKESQKKILTSSAAYDTQRPERTKFDGAKELAVEFSRAWVAAIRDEAGDKAWALVYDSGRAASLRIQMEYLNVFLGGKLPRDLILGLGEKNIF